MTLVPGVFSHSTVATFADARRDLEGTVVRDASGKMRAGLFYDPNPLFTRRMDMRLDVHSFRAVQDRGGALFFANQGTATTPQFENAPSANRRIDLLYVTHEIPALDGGTNALPVFGIEKGDANPTPVAPPLPSSKADAIPLLHVEIPAGATTMQSAGVIITPVAPFTAMAGGTVVVRNLVELAAWTPPDGARAYCLSDSCEYSRRSGTWRLLTDGEWIVAPNLNQWGTLARLSYRKRADGIVELVGYAVKNAGFGLFVLPAGMRPGVIGADTGIKTVDTYTPTRSFTIRGSGSVEYGDNTSGQGVAIDFRFKAVG